MSEEHGTRDDQKRDVSSPASVDQDLSEAVHTSEDEAKAGPSVFSSRQISRVRDLLARLNGVRRAMRFYPVEHPAVSESVDELMAVIGEYHAEGTDVPVTFHEDELLLGEHLLPEDSLLFDQLIRDMTSIGAGCVTFERGLDSSELLRAMQVLAMDESEVTAAGGVAALAERLGVDHVDIKAVTVVADAGPDMGSDESARASYTSALDLLRDLEAAIVRRHPLPATQTKTVVRSLVENVLSNRFAMLELAGLKDYDEYTFFHSVNVAVLSLALGSTITSDRRFLNSLGSGALMHDIGKMAVESAILNKPGALSGDEWAEMRMHPLRGAELVVTMPGMDKASIIVILEHHMRCDGRGYPQTPVTRRQHLASRIVAVADAFDAMTSRRSYSAPRLPDEAMGILVDGSGDAFDPRLVRLFVKLMGVFPPRSAVRLSDGSLGIVIKVGTDISRPTVRLIADSSGNPIEGLDLDLSDAVAAGGLDIKGCVPADSLNVDVEDYV